MRTASRFVATAVMAAGISVSGASAALAQDSCAYVPTSCETPTEVVPTTQDRTEVLPTTQDRTEVNARTDVAEPETLPFTGVEIALAAVLGAGAVAGGAALVVAARRRPTASH
jgi:carbohydrate-binding DOMON domain-containing protein